MPKTKKCEHCGKSVNEKYTVCPICGGHIRGKVKSLPPVCPWCKTSLEILVKDGEEYDLCTKCGGLWLDRGKFHRATRTFDVYQKEKYEGEYVKTPSKDPGGYMPCVRCGKLMNRKNFGSISGVMIDKCSRHGVWLDAGELEKIRHFIADGGLERSQNREIRRNREQIRELASTVKEINFTQRLIHFWNPKRWLFRGF